MQTDKIQVNSKGDGRAEALQETAKFAVYQGLSEKDSLRVELLCEEAVGLVSAIAGDFEAEYWIECGRDKLMELHLQLTTKMDASKRREMIEASTSGKNAAAVGFMGKVRAVIERGIYAAGELGKTPEGVDSIPLYMYDDVGTHDGFAVGPVGYMWSMERYRGAVSENREKDSKAKEAWDELEKSIVANIADDVRVGVRGRKAEVVIVKQL